MTSTPVAGSVNSQLASLLNTVQTSNKTGGPDFKSFMNRQDTEAGAIQDRTEKPETVSKDTKPVTEGNSVREVRSAENGEADTEITEAKVNKVEDAVNAVEKTVEEELDVTIEEVSEVLSNMGLNILGLLDAERMPEIVVELTGAEDTLAIATDPDLYEALSNITETVGKAVENLTEELKIPSEEFTEALKEAEVDEILKEEPVEENIPLPVNNAKLAEKIEVVIPTGKDLKAESKEEPETKIEIRTQSAMGIEEDRIESKTETFRPVSSSEPEEEHEQPAFEGRENPMNFAERLLAKTVESFNEKAQEITYSEMDVQDIMDQMTESIRVTATPENHEINIKLHPESLGSVSVKVSANSEGVLRAQFITQNEGVKAIVESQAIVLREALESKGVTVEAVEVLVQSHEFERNLSDQNRGNSQGEEPKRRGIRRINLLNPAGDEIETEEDTIVREMMEQNGNTIDYSI
ncbi:MAG: flagellar hook-length control protein FliK [Lachnospiraceae bacterium]|nr:flagellar hook-length control protein FliK [Lachnospiraceae bacterium]